MAIQQYNITTNMGKVTSGDSLDNLLSADEQGELDNIGYSGKTFRGVRMTRSGYLNSLNKGEFIVTQLRYDTGDFTEHFLITCNS